VKATLETQQRREKKVELMMAVEPFDNISPTWCCLELTFGKISYKTSHQQKKEEKKTMKMFFQNYFLV
jgi:hypothetical protein